MVVETGAGRLVVQRSVESGGFDWRSSRQAERRDGFRHC